MKLLLLSLLLFTTSIFPQNKINPNRLYSDYALKASRVEYKDELNAKIKNIFSGKLNSSYEKKWKSLFKEVGLMLVKTEDIYSAIRKASKYAPKGSLSFKRSLVETIITLYPTEFRTTIDTLFTTTNDPTLYSYCIQYYLKSDLETSDYLLKQTKERFPNWEKIPQLKFLAFYLDNTELQTPPLKDILSNKFIEGKTIIYTFQRKDRTYPGITIIKRPNGEFVKDKNNSIFYVQQMALSVTNLPGYLSQGNTPQGIFSVVGYYNSPTPSIGPTAAVLTRIPYEVPTKLWFHKTVTGKWNKKEV
jgi:hypothetical protein